MPRFYFDLLEDGTVVEDQEGVVLPDIAAAGREAVREAGDLGRRTAIAGADDHARSLLPLLRMLRVEGAITIGAVTRSLNERKIPTARGAQWHVSSVANLLARASRLESAR